MKSKCRQSQQGVDEQAVGEIQISKDWARWRGERAYHRGRIWVLDNSKTKIKKQIIAMKTINGRLN